MNMKVKNLRLNLNKEGLYKEEISVILAVLEAVLSQGEIPMPKTGTFLLLGQKYDEEAKRIISFEFENGPTRNFCGRGQSSTSEVERVMKRAVKATHERGTSAISYLPDTELYLDLETTNGRFLAFFFANNGDFFDLTIVYCALMATIAQMGREDEVLQQSCDNTFWTEVEDAPGLSKLRWFIDDLFEKEKLPEIRTWKEWHEPANKSGELELFFG